MLDFAIYLGAFMLGCFLGSVAMAFVAGAARGDDE